MTAGEWVAVSAVSGGVFVCGGENGGTVRSSAVRPPSVGAEVRVRPQNGSANGAMGHGQSRLEAPIGHALRLHRLLRLQAPLFRVRIGHSQPGLFVFFGSHSQHHSW